MTPAQLHDSKAILDEVLETITARLGRPERREAMVAYVHGLMLDGERKSIQPMALRLASSEVEADAMRQRLQQCVAVATWDHKKVFARTATMALQRLPSFQAYVIDDTGFAKKGKASPGVARQYSGTLGRIDNCQVATSVHLAADSHSICVGMRLFLPEEWCTDRERCAKVGIPETIVHQTKAQLALELLDDARAVTNLVAPVLADAGYGNSVEFRQSIRDRGLHYVVAVNAAHLGWPPGIVPTVASRKGQPGRPPTRDQAGGVKPLAYGQIASTLRPRKITWREGSRGPQSGKFAAVRLYSAEGRTKKVNSSEPIWLIAQWRGNSSEPTHFYLSSLPATTSLRELVGLIKLRWRVERDYQELKSEVGLDHYEGRTWDGIHHHFALCAVAHFLLALLRESFSPG